MIYGELALAAIDEMDFSTIGSQAQPTKKRKAVETLRHRIRTHQEEELGLTKYDFPMKCPSSGLLGSLLQKSLEIEKYLFPSFFDSDQGFNDLFEDFRRQSTTKLCDIDIDTTLKQNKCVSS